MGKVLGWIVGTTAGKWVGGIAIVSLLAGGLIWLKVHDAKVREEERAKQADAFTQEIEKLREVDRAKTDEILQAAQAKQEAAERRVEASMVREASLLRTLSAIGQQRAATTTETVRLSDSERRPYIIRSLGLRQANDTTPCYTAAEEKAIVEAVSQFPLCQKQVEATNAQVLEIKQQVQALTDKSAALEQKFDVLSGYTTRLESYYVQVYNALPRKRRGWKCLGLWACGKAKPLPVPAPIDLKGSAPK
mgnify:FL=1